MGTPTQHRNTAATLYANGWTGRRIAQHLGISLGTVYYYIDRNRKLYGWPEPRYRAKHAQNERREKLLEQAALRGTNTSALQKTIIRVVCNDNLFNAILGEPK